MGAESDRKKKKKIHTCFEEDLQFRRFEQGGRVPQQ